MTTIKQTQAFKKENVDWLNHRNDVACPVINEPLSNSKFGKVY